MLHKTALASAPFKSVLRRHKYHPEGLPLYNDLSKQWLCREGERWWLLDARGEQLPHVAKIAAQYITGQHRPDFTPGMITGDHVVITNIKDAVMTGDNWIRVPITWQTAYPGGSYRVRLSEMYERDPCMVMWWYLKDEVNHHFVRKLKTRTAPLEKAWLYEGSTHPHGDKNPRPLLWSDTQRTSWRYKDRMFQRRWSPNQFMM
ncbi:50S ribosomal protein L13-like protein [Leptomonas seymouri]|uniref:50S ribosomal protein L13-like protein n=1 Tax=Leptomonas seymouri TaxID=5684 RepID=A0A0N1ILM7_LEPSE|nr:50S ribosomal protein L13-like protein [Leptomonas seymouri]|eukprot:KPI88000.1 50S ribosomal protein L13-like protein [Leptomonas seymouri]